MKKTIISTMAAAALLLSCSPENLKEANFNLYQAEEMSVIAGDGNAMVSWTSQEGKPEPLDWLVTWTPDSDAIESGSHTVEPAGRELLVDGLENDCSYTFAVQARYEDGLSMKVTAVATPKSTRIAPTSFRAIAGDGVVVLSWVAPETSLDYTYRLTVSSNGTVSDTQTLEQGTTSYRVEDLTNGTQYTFSLTCVYSHGDSETVEASAIPGDISPVTVESTTLRQYELATFEYNPAYFGENISSVSWDFGDGASSSETAPQHLYTSTGTYIVEVTVNYSDGSDQKGSIQMTVEPFAWSKTSGLGYQKASSVVFSHDGQTFYMGSPTKPTGLFAVSAITGQVVWSYATTGNVYGEGPAVGPDGTIYFSDEGGTFYAVSPSGSLKWQFSIGSGQNASPAVTSDGTVYVIASGVLTALDANGGTMWSATLDGTPGGIVVDAEGTVYAGTNTGIWAYSESGTQKWKSAEAYAVTERGGSLAIHDGVLYAVLKAKGGCVALDAATGNELWQYETSENDCYHPVVDTEGNVYFCEKNGYVYSVSKSGSLRWKGADKSGYTYSGFALGSDGKAYISQYGGDQNLVSFDMATGSMSLVYAIGAQTMSPVIIGPDCRIYYGLNPDIETYNVGVSHAEGGWPMRGGNLQGTNSLK